MAQVTPQQCDCNQITIIAAPTYRRFATRIEGSDRFLVVSTFQPLLDSARRLLERGYDHALTLVLRHAGSSTEALRSTIGTAARLRVAEPDRGSPHFRLWRPYSSSPEALPMHQSAPGGTSMAGEASTLIAPAAEGRS